MDIHTFTRELHVKNDSKIVMLVADGLGGLPMTPGGKTELESANRPNLNALATIGVQGGSIPVAPGISPGSGPGHGCSGSCSRRWPGRSPRCRLLAHSWVGCA